MATPAVNTEDRTTVNGSQNIEAPDLNEYFQRIGYKGARAPSLEVLSEIHRLHPQAIPFENLNPLLRIPVLLDIHSIETKLIAGRRGGYCFEQNLMLSSVLKRLGFTVRGLAARVLWNVPEGAVTPRGHMLLLIDIEDQRFIADVGFGGMTLTSPLLLTPDRVQHTAHEDFRLLKDREDFILQAKVRDSWRAVYRFSLEEQFLPDYEVSSWYLSNHPASHFISSLIAARTMPGLRYSLRNNELATHQLDGGTERRTIADSVELKKILKDIFLINLPDHPALDRILLLIAEGKSVV